LVTTLLLTIPEKMLRAEVDKAGGEASVPEKSILVITPKEFLDTSIISIRYNENLIDRIDEHRANSEWERPREESP